MDYSDKTALVTGGANGIGRAIAHAFLAAGATVLVLDIDEKAGAALAQSCRNGENLFFHAIDLTQAEAVCSLYAALTARHGRIDILINNAGKGRFKPLTELLTEEWDEILNLNLRAAFILSREFARYNRGTPYGRIINIASTRFLMSEPGSEAYAASKGGIVALTHALALSLSDERITVNCISPGWIETRDYAGLRPEDHRQHPSGRVGEPDDIARACLFLTDAANDFIDGQNLIIDGGMTRKMIYLE